MERGHTGNQDYRVNVNGANTCGLSAKQIMALCYHATHDQEKLIIGNKLNESGEIVAKTFAEASEGEQAEFLQQTEFKFIDFLYQIRRGYNIDSGQDNPDTYKFTESIDKNVCLGGTVN